MRACRTLESLRIGLSCAFLMSALACGPLQSARESGAVLELEAYDLERDAFIPQEARGVNTLIRVPAKDLGTLGMGDNVALCFAEHQGVLQYRASSTRDTGCPDGTTPLVGEIEWFDRGHETGFVDIEIIPVEEQKRLYTVVREWDKGEIPLIRIVVKLQDGKWVFDRVERTLGIPGHRVTI